MNRERRARSSGEPLRGRAVPDHLLARDRDVGGRIGTHRRQLVGVPQQLPQPVRDDLRHGFGAADEDAEHLGGDLDVVECPAVGQPITEQAVDHRQCAIRGVGPSPPNRGDEVFEVVRPGLGGVDPATGLGETARVDRGQHIGGEIDRNTEQFAHHGRDDDPAVLLGEVERSAREQLVEPFIGQFLRHRASQPAAGLGRNG